MPISRAEIGAVDDRDVSGSMTGVLLRQLRAGYGDDMVARVLTLAEDPETMERLGEVPVAVIEKAKTSGGHNLSGAVMRPGPLEELFPDMTREQWREEGFAFGEVRKEAIYLLPSARTKVRIPPPPPQRNHGNEVISVSALARYQQRQAEEGGAYVLTELHKR